MEAGRMLMPSIAMRVDGAVVAGLGLFLCMIVGIVLANNRSLLFARHGRSHRLLGCLHLLWIAVGLAAEVASNPSVSWHPASQSFLGGRLRMLLYDGILGVLGIATTLTAAKEFPHRLVKNAHGQSGTLHHRAIVTQAEMIEHSFYQALNLWQSLCLHAMANVHRITPSTNLDRSAVSIVLLWLSCAPWFLRHKYPVHSFSANWKGRLHPHSQPSSSPSSSTTAEQSHMLKKDATADTSSPTWEFELLLYRIKKMQYLFYKHVILHGINISMAVLCASSADDDARIPYDSSWRLFWLLLNTSYVMEFFLQTLVKRRMLSQARMLLLQRFLMLIASLSAMQMLLLPIRSPFASSSSKDGTIIGLVGAASLLSLIGNFVHRHHDVLNTTLIGSLFIQWVKRT